MPKILCLSDTHGQHEQVVVPKSDILIHAGDWSNQGTFKDLVDFANWYEQQDASAKIVIAGNHDLFAEKDYSSTERIFGERGIFYLEDDYCTIDGLVIYGSPFTPKFFDWSFMLERGELYSKKWSRIPDYTNILIAHGPMYGVLDTVAKLHNGETDNHVGCKELLKRVKELSDLQLFVHGHIHSGYGYEHLYDDCMIVNASTCNEKYAPLNKPIEVNL